MDKYKQTAESLLSKMGSEYASVEVFEDGGNSYRISIQSKDSPILIGRGGEHLQALGTILSKILSKDDPSMRFLVDVNNYLGEEIEKIKTKAKIFADRARNFKCDIELEPMTGQTRRLVHSMFENDPNIKTKSKGEGLERRIVLCYHENENL
jgi:spoIIIJ-associated protein